MFPGYRRPVVAVLGAFALLAVLAVHPRAAGAWVRDGNTNRIDDLIERVHRLGWRASFQNDDPARTPMIAVTDGAVLRYAIYVGYDRAPGATESAALSATGVAWVRPYLHIPYIRTEATYAQIEAILALPGVTRIEAVPMLSRMNQIGTRVVRARDSRGYVKSQNDVLFPSVRQELGLDGTGITVAIFDTGVNDAADVTSYPGHESLQGKFLGGGEFFYGNPILNTPNTGSMNPQDHGAMASQYHGTHVAGTAIGSGGPGGTFAGVAPGARLVDCKVLSDAGASVSGLPEAVEWCLFNRATVWPGLTGADTAYRGIDVINMSLGDVLSSDGSEADAQAVNAAMTGGIVVVCASGNLGLTGWIASPGSADLSICVGASEHAKSLDRGDDRVTSFAQEGPRADDGDLDHRDEMKPNVVAPGLGIVSADGDPTTDGRKYKALSGTSMASPHVAGCVALVLQANPSLTPLAVRAILENTAEHNLLSSKGDRPNDPFGLDPNYDPGCGWGLVDVYAAAKEALNSAAGVQVVQMKKPVARVVDGAIDLGWVTQREYAFLGFEVYRAPDMNGAPGAFARINATLVAPSAASDPFIAGDDNRTPYAWTDSDPALTAGQVYWYRVAWVDVLTQVHVEPALSVEYGDQPRVATAYYSIVHDAPDSDLDLTIGTSAAYTAATPDYATIPPGAAARDSFQFAPIDFFYVPPGHIRHYWTLPFTVSDGIGPYLPPSPAHPWFLSVVEGGFSDQSGRLESFSLFVNDSPGSASGVTYVTNSITPQPTIETLRSTLWIPESAPTAVVVASFAARSEPAGVRVTLRLSRPSAAGTAQVFRSHSSEFATRVSLTEPAPIAGDTFEHLDETATPGVTYYYWAVVEDADGAIVSGPVSGVVAGAIARTMLTPPAPNPMRRGGMFRYAIGAEAGAGGKVDVALGLYDLNGRLVRELASEPAGAGEHQVAWDGTDRSGAPVAGGLYFLRLKAGATVLTTRISVVR